MKKSLLATLSALVLLAACDGTPEKTPEKSASADAAPVQPSLELRLADGFKPFKKTDKSCDRLLSVLEVDAVRAILKGEKALQEKFPKVSKITATVHEGAAPFDTGKGEPFKAGRFDMLVGKGDKDAEGYIKLYFQPTKEENKCK